MLRMMGAKIEHSALLFGDNKSVILNTIVPNSVLKKKYCAVIYHKIWEYIAYGKIRFAPIDSSVNYADILTKATTRAVFQELKKLLLFGSPPNVHN